MFIALLVGILGWLPALGGMATVLGLTYLNSKSATGRPWLDPLPLGLTAWGIFADLPPPPAAPELGKAARKAVVITDKRVKVAKEIVSGIKVGDPSGAS